MLRQLLLDDVGLDTDPEARAGWARVEAEFPTVSVQSLAAGGGAQVLTLDVSEWGAPGFDPSDWDPRVLAASGTERLALRLTGGHGARLASAALEILTRYQGLVGRRNAASSGGLFDVLLARHRALYDLTLPRGCADYLRALDTWQWVLRLAPEADLALQVAALFHDVERPASEADPRVQDLQAARGARRASTLLRELGVEARTCERVRHLVLRRERSGQEAALALLDDADAFALLSLNASSAPRALRPEHHGRLERLRLASAMRTLLDVRPATAGAGRERGAWSRSPTSVHG